MQFRNYFLVFYPSGLKFFMGVCLKHTPIKNFKPILSHSSWFGWKVLKNRCQSRYNGTGNTGRWYTPLLIFISLSVNGMFFLAILWSDVLIESQLGINNINCSWKQKHERVVMIPTLLSLPRPGVVITTTSATTSDDKVGIMTAFDSKWISFRLLFLSSILPTRSFLANTLHSYNYLIDVIFMTW